jgi:hypothetical protein
MYILIITSNILDCQLTLNKGGNGIVRGKMFIFSSEPRDFVLQYASSSSFGISR